MITPLLKKPGLDPTDVKNYRLISNLSVLSKLIERMVANQLVDYLNTNDLIPDRQSSYRKNHSTEMTLAQVLSDIFKAIDTGNMALLSLLDLSAAFDTVDLQIPFRRLHFSYGLNSTVLD
jgi:Reverse transcriptase (RNA-dependent DNA polymerase)